MRMSIHINGYTNINRNDLHYLSRDLVSVYAAMEEASFDKKLLQITQTAINLAEDVEDCVEDTELSDWKKYELDDEEKDLNEDIQANLAALRALIGTEDRIKVGNSTNEENGYVTFTNEELYSNFLTYEEAKGEICCILAGIRLERGSKL